MPEILKVPGVDVYFIGTGDLSQSMGYTGQQTHPEVQRLVEHGIKVIRDGGRIAGCSSTEARIPTLVGLGVQYFHDHMSRLLQKSSEAYLKNVRQAAEKVGL